MRIQSKRSAIERPRCGTVAETGGDEAPVEELHRILSPEPQRPLRVVQGLATVAGARERPTEHVVADDARTLRIAASSEQQSMVEAPAVIDVEERDVEVVAHAVRGEQPLDDVDERVLA